MNGQKVQGIVDTRAKQSLLSTKAAKKANIYNNINKKTKDRVRGVGGVSKLFGYIQNLAVYIGQAVVYMDVEILEEDGFDFLLGRDILLEGF